MDTHTEKEEVPDKNGSADSVIFNAEELIVDIKLGISRLIKNELPSYSELDGFFDVLLNISAGIILVFPEEKFVYFISAIAWISRVVTHEATNKSGKSRITQENFLLMLWMGVMFFYSNLITVHLYPLYVTVCMGYTIFISLKTEKYRRMFAFIGIHMAAIFLLSSHKSWFPIIDNNLLRILIVQGLVAIEIITMYETHHQSVKYSLKEKLEVFKKEIIPMQIKRINEKMASSRDAALETAKEHMSPELFEASKGTVQKVSEIVPESLAEDIGSALDTTIDKIDNIGDLKSLVDSEEFSKVDVDPSIMEGQNINWYMYFIFPNSIIFGSFLFIKFYLEYLRTDLVEYL